ncbi:hypothetical protein [Lichenifustis flavocetrariae]|uniref:Uncharacterized protein n=1 Tax=Lichenifustis flavocetrariae TaxID=2949735 RepID=A0AA42CMQ9_9HYPH|nr:hypothetical protein [Lichenifustis flavocetrariae]MCW6512783.1 hypothetical protein [Lichenifustis flavocetrariae]
MIEEGSRVTLRIGSTIARQHPALADAVGIVGAMIEGRRWHRLDATDAERQGDRAAHVRLRQPPIVLMSVPVTDLEPVDQLDPVRA